jgi:ABC-type transporter Mla subunit MlaD
MTFQRTLFGDIAPVGDIEARILTAYRDNPKIADSDRLLILGVWQLEGLGEVLGDKLDAFRQWFRDAATSTETITRAGRKLRATGLMRASPEVTEARRQLAEAHRSYWRR